MHSHRYFPCLCGARIYAPLAISPETSRIQIPWPMGAEEQTFLCFQCKQARQYTRSNFLLDPAPSPVIPDICGTEAVHLLSLSCAIEKCRGLIQTHLVMKRGLSIADAAGFSTKIHFHGIPCNTNGHIHTGIFAESFCIRFEVAQEWMAL